MNQNNHVPQSKALIVKKVVVSYPVTPTPGSDSICFITKNKYKLQAGENSNDEVYITSKHFSF